MKGAFLAILFILAAISADVAVAHRTAWLPWRRHHPVPWWPLSPAVKKCLGDYPGVHKCLFEIYWSYEKQKTDISSECCKAINHMNDDCASTIFANFKSPFYLLVWQQCSTAAPVEPPAA